jgi:hypothetical protein
MVLGFGQMVFDGEGDLFFSFKLGILQNIF